MHDFRYDPPRRRAALRRLTAVAFVAVRHAMPRRAVIILEAVTAAEPGRPALEAALAAAYLNAGRGDDALRLLRRLRQTRSDDQTLGRLLNAGLELCRRGADAGDAAR